MARPRSPLKSLASLLDASQALVALFDSRQTLLYASARCGEHLGVAVELLLGRQARYTSEPLSDALEAAIARLSPPPQAFAGESAETTWACQADGPPFRVRFVPLPLESDETMSDHAVLVIASPVEATEPVDVASLADWHAALVEARSQLPPGMQSEHFLGDSPAMHRLRAQVQMAASTRARVVVAGARGTGCDEIARAIYTIAGGSAAGLVSLRCAIQDAESLQSSLRTLHRRKRAANEGPPTLLLQEVGRLSESAQGELLGFLQIPGFEGRTLATSRVPLDRLVRQRRFSAELAARLGTLEIRVPALKGRPVDVPLLAQAAIERFNAQSRGQQFSGLVPDALEKLVAYSWPGNIDELREVIRTVCEKAAGPWIIAGDLPLRIHGAWSELAHPGRRPEAIELDAFLAGIEKELLARAVGQAKGNKSVAARLLGISRPRLLRRLVQLGLATREETNDAEAAADTAAEAPTTADFTDAIDFQPLDAPNNAPAGESP
jgi:DNA-binding NtrC family response regulator